MFLNIKCPLKKNIEQMDFQYFQIAAGKIYENPCTNYLKY